jgi:vacuolar-type H+-ATPase subunit E/Vma4
MRDDITALFAWIRERAEAEKAEITAQADREIAQIDERAEGQINRLRKEMLAQLEEQLHIESDCILSAAKLEIDNRLVDEKNVALDKVFSLASQQIEALNSDTRKEIFRELIDDAISRINSEQAYLRISKADLPLWEKLKKGFPKSISVELCDGVTGTVIVETSDRSQLIDNSIHTRLEMAEKIMRRELGELLSNSERTGEKGE